MREEWLNWSVRSFVRLASGLVGYAILFICGVRHSKKSARALCYTYDTMAQALTLAHRPEVIVLDESL